MLNRIVMKGFGPSRGVIGRSSPIVHGYGGKVPEFIPEIATEVTRLRIGGGRSSRREEIFDTIIVWAKLIELNGRPPKVTVVGQTSKSFAESTRKVQVEHKSTRKRVSDAINVVVKWVKRT